jgi:hypothetical protein
MPAIGFVDYVTQASPANKWRLREILTIFSRFGRGERIRTSGLYVPNVALYQAKLHPDCDVVMHVTGSNPAQ